MQVNNSTRGKDNKCIKSCYYNPIIVNVQVNDSTRGKDNKCIKTCYYNPIIVSLQRHEVLSLLLFRQGHPTSYFQKPAQLNLNMFE